MKLKNLATTAACVAALASGVGAAPAAAKNDKPKNANHKNGQYKHGGTASGQCSSGYSVISAITAGVETDFNANGYVCYSSTLGYVDDKSA